MKKIIAAALLIAALLTAFHGFSMTAPVPGPGYMSRVNDMLGTINIQAEIPAYDYDTSNRGTPYYVVAVLAGAAGILILSGLNDIEEENEG
ncbi:hypothetical protein [Maridesulfovibrio sp.]|uniref:hypothetical protein n=1 Tax=Maridesulfovibrio sp. TaxID=2795000 RepID=UPI002A18C95E|nr:hypothetical protein [Maridesulfovibrio sp.]